MSIELPNTFENRAFLGKSEAAKVDATTEKLLRVVIPTNDTEIRAASENARIAINDLGFKADSVQSLIDVKEDRFKTLEQKKIAEANLDILAKSVFVVMRYGGDSRYQDVLIKGGAGEIDKLLPDPLKGLGERVRTNIISNETVLNELKALDETRSNFDLDIPMDKKAFAEEARETFLRLAQIRGLDDNGKRELMMVRAYLSQEIEGLTSREKSNAEMKELVDEIRGLRDDEREKQRLQQQRELEMARQREEQIEEGRHDFYMAMLIHEAPQQTDPFSQMAPEWMKNVQDKALLQKIIALHNSANMKLKYGNQFLDELIDPKGQGTYSASNEVMKKYYREIPGYRESMEHFVQDFFEPRTENGRFVLRLKGQAMVSELRNQALVYRAEGREVPEELKNTLKAAEDEFKKRILGKFENIRAEQLEWVRALKGRMGGGVQGETDALRATAIAWCLLFVGNTFESGDFDKDIPPCEAATAQAWNFCHPDNKARNKIVYKEKELAGETLGTEEGWGGSKGQWLAKRFEKARNGSQEDIDFVTKYVKGEIKPFPERMFCSFIEHTDVNVVGQKDKVPMAEALYNGWEIDYDAMSLSSDPWGSYYDMGDSANKLYQATTGKLDLQLDNNGLRGDAQKWVATVADARNKLRGNPLLRPYVDNRDFVLWAIVGAVKGGLYMNSTKLVMLTADVFTRNQYWVVKTLLETRELVNDNDVKWIMEQLNCENNKTDYKRKKIVGRTIL